MLNLTSVLCVTALLVPTSDVLIENGQARSVIVIPDDASPTVDKASHELADYLQRISGADLPIVSESQASSAVRIDVGPTRHAQTCWPDEFSGDEERVLVQTVPGGLIICGGGDRGTLYAVYRFLESLGCRWLTAEPENELVPRTQTIALSDIKIDTRPAFDWRFFYSGSPEHTKWGLKLGFNGLYDPNSAAASGGSLYWPAAVRGVHAFDQIMPPEKYFRAHPEWSPLIDGKRSRSATGMPGQLCVTAPGLADEFAANVIRIFDEDPRARVTSISPNDGFGWCECSSCQELDKKLCGGRTTSQGLAREEQFVGDRVFWFSNEVARRVRQEHPDRELLVLAYINYAEPPDTIIPAENIVPFVCHYAPADYSRPINDPTSGANRQFDQLLQRWVAISPDVMIYSYVSKGMWWRLPRPVLSNFSTDVKYFHQLGITRYYCQSPLSDWALDGPLYYVIGRLLWDPTADPQALADEWVSGMFGPAAAEMTEFYDAVERSVRVTGQPYSDNPPGQVPGLYDPAELKRAMAALERAENTPASESVRRRIETVATTFRNGYWMIKALEQDKLGDPIAIRWFTGFAYLLGIVVCGMAWVSERRNQLSNDSATPTFWMVLIVMLLLLWVNKYADLQTLLIDSGRKLFESQNWYQDRGRRKAVFIAIAGVVGVAGLGGMAWLAHGRWKRNLPAVMGVLCLGAFLLVQASSFHNAAEASPFHQMDVAFRRKFAGWSCRSVVDFTAISMVVLGATLVVKNRRNLEHTADEPRDTTGPG